MNPRFEKGDKLVEPSTGRVGIVTGVIHAERGSEYTILWCYGTNNVGVYRDVITKDFQRVETCWNKLMSSDDY